jgi:hypothetical protein
MSAIWDAINHVPVQSVPITTKYKDMFLIFSNGEVYMILLFKVCQ